LSITTWFLLLQLALADVVFEVQRELARIDAAPGEGGRVGRQAVHFEVAEDQLDFGEAGGIEGVDLADGARQAKVIHLAVEFQLAGGTGARGEAGDGTAQLVDAGAEGEEQRFVGEIEFAVAEAQAVDVHQEGRAGLAALGGVSAAGAGVGAGATAAGALRPGFAGCGRRCFRLAQDALEIGALVLGDQELGVEAVEHQFADLQLLRRDLELPGAEAISSRGRPCRCRLR
jgi:hypothetical protein